MRNLNNKKIKMNHPLLFHSQTAKVPVCVFLMHSHHHALAALTIQHDLPGIKLKKANDFKLGMKNERSSSMLNLINCGIW